MKFFLVLAISIIFFSCPNPSQPEINVIKMQLQEEGESFQSYEFEYDFGQLQINQQLTKEFLIKVVEGEIPQAEISCDSEFFQVTVNQAEKEFRVQVTNRASTVPAFHLGQITLKWEEGEFLFAVMARQTDTLRGHLPEIPVDLSLKVGEQSFQSVLSQRFSSTDWQISGETFKTQNDILGLAEGTKIIFPLENIISYGVFNVDLSPFSAESSIQLQFLPLGSTEFKSVELPTLPLAQWTRLQVLVTSQRLVFFYGENTIKEIPLNGNDSPFDQGSLFTSFGISAAKGKVLFDGANFYEAQFSTENETYQFIATVQGEKRFFKTLQMYSFSTMSNSDYETWKEERAVGLDGAFLFEEGKGIKHTTIDSKIIFTKSNIPAASTWDALFVTTTWDSQYKPNFFLHNTEAPPYGFSFYKEGNANGVQCFIFDGEAGAWNGGEEDRSCSFTYGDDEIVCIGCYQGDNRKMSVIRDYTTVHDFTWGGAKDFSEFENFVFGFNNDAADDVGYLYIKAISFYQSEVLDESN